MTDEYTFGRPRKPLPPGLRGELAVRVRTLREKRNWTSRQFADVAGLGLGTILRLESGKSMDATTWVAVAKALGMSPAELLNGCPSWKKNESKTQ